MKTVDREKLWGEYQKNPSSALREKLITEYAPLVKVVAGRLSMYLGYNVEYEDLVMEYSDLSMPLISLIPEKT